MRRPRSKRCWPLLFAALVGSACGDDVVRVLALQPAGLHLPMATSKLSGNTLTVEAMALEPLKSEARYVVWADDTLLGTLELSKIFSIDVTSVGLTASAIQTLLVTEERVSSPSSPSTRVRLRGQPGGALAYTSIGDSQAAQLEASVELRNHEAHVTFSGPPLEGGLSYVLWVGYKPSLEHGHGDSSDDHGLRVAAAAGHGEGDACEGPVLSSDCMPERTAILLSDAQTSYDSDELLGAASWAFITIEASDGSSAMSPTILLWAEAKVGEDSEPSGESAPHAH